MVLVGEGTHGGPSAGPRAAGVVHRDRPPAEGGGGSEARKKYERDKRNMAKRLARMSAEEREEYKRKQRDYQRRWREENRDRLRKKRMEKRPEYWARMKREQRARMSAEERAEINRREIEARRNKLARMSAEEREESNREKRDYGKRWMADRKARMSAEEKAEYNRKRREYMRRWRAENGDRLNEREREKYATKNKKEKTRESQKREREESDGIEAGAASRSHSTKDPPKGIARRGDVGNRASEIGLGHRKSNGRADGPCKKYKDSNWNPDEGNFHLIPPFMWNADHRREAYNAPGGFNGLPSTGRAHQSREVFEAAAGREREGRRQEEWDALVRATVAVGAGGGRELRCPETGKERERQRRDEWDAIVRASLGSRTQGSRLAAGYNDHSAGERRAIQTTTSGLHAVDRSNETSHMVVEEVESADGILDAILANGKADGRHERMITGREEGSKGGRSGVSQHDVAVSDLLSSMRYRGRVSVALAEHLDAALQEQWRSSRAPTTAGQDMGDGEDPQALMQRKLAIEARNAALAQKLSILMRGGAGGSQGAA